jgi:hypothetical protein
VADPRVKKAVAQGGPWRKSSLRCDSSSQALGDTINASGQAKGFADTLRQQAANAADDLVCGPVQCGWQQDAKCDPLDKLSLAAR